MMESSASPRPGELGAAGENEGVGLPPEDAVSPGKGPVGLLDGEAGALLPAAEVLGGLPPGLGVQAARPATARTANTDRTIRRRMGSP
jgi:hypothetical protein